MSTHQAAGSPGASLLVAKGHAMPTASRADNVRHAAPTSPQAAPRSAADGGARPIPARPDAARPAPAATLTGVLLRERGLAAHVAAGIAEARKPGAEIRPLRRGAAEEPARPEPAAPKPDPVRLTVPVDRGLHRRLKLAATHLGRPVRSLAAEALADYLATVAAGPGRDCACLARAAEGREDAAGCGEDGCGPSNPEAPR